MSPMRASSSPIRARIETMRELAERGVAQACVSNSGRTIVDANIKALGVGKLIAFSLSLDDVSSGKPDPEPYREAARRLGAASRTRRGGRGQRRGRPLRARGGAVRGRLFALGPALRRL